MEKKFQIFVSSTFEDLRSERECVAKSILEIGDIPVGMEMFSAADESQWRLIKRQIEQSDYYIVLVAHRYGTIFENVSFTEREYDYAVERGVPVLGFILDKNVEWPPVWIDADADSRSKLEAFKSKVMSKMVSFWTNSDSLTSKVLAALSKQKNLNPMPGWVRATNMPGPEVLTELARLGTEVVRLSEENSKLREQAGQDTRFELIDAMADDSDCQALILMHELQIDMPRNTSYIYRTKNSGIRGSGSFAAYGRDRLHAAGIVRPSGSGQFISLTEEGKQFVQWLLKKGRKCSFLWTPLGGWGALNPEDPEDKWLAESVEKKTVQPAAKTSPTDTRDFPISLPSALILPENS
ncbi:uncharacterized protein DUF4062 [Prosthecobacter fusiformis]|uniref:Uncharacterized protein DUF4062 n=1 Tax=Prosthecobacter fusiformis TaxID=48464 RepID=A0A4R7RM78_9BACT|nr:DUF4062 domain-containing protein [Prosthecobacter fusiformis]TDU66500.1 uncharacterized protein DUF4062 [Prosthecobacter fusiformis]